MATDSWAPNAFFVKTSELPADFQEQPTRELTPWSYFGGPPNAAERPWVSV